MQEHNESAIWPVQPVVPSQPVVSEAQPTVPTPAATPVQVATVPAATAPAQPKPVPTVQESIAEETLKTLKAIERQSKKQTAYMRICASGTIVTAVLVVVAVIAGFVVYQRVEAAMETVMQELDEFAAQISTINLDEMSDDIADMVENIDGLVGESREGVMAASEALEGIDFDALNDAIEDLGDVIEPLAKFFNIF